MRPGAAGGDIDLEAFRREGQRFVDWVVRYLGEPGRFRIPRDEQEAECVHDDESVHRWFMPTRPRLFLTHMRPEPFLGALRRLDGGRALTHALGYRNRGGTLDVDGLMFANRCTWAHAVAAAATLMGVAPTAWLSSPEYDAVMGQGTPSVLWCKESR